MIRAIQTADLISQSLPDVPVKCTEILCEGEPIRPEPEVPHWKPEKWVSFIVSIYLSIPLTICLSIHLFVCPTIHLSIEVFPRWCSN